MAGQQSRNGSECAAADAVRALVGAQPRQTALAFALALLGAVIGGAGLLLLARILGVVTGAGELAWVRSDASR